MGIRRFRREFRRIQEQVDPVGSQGDLVNLADRSKFDGESVVRSTVNAALASETASMNEAEYQANLARLRDEYERRRRGSRTQTILTSGTGASGTPETSRPTLLGGR